MMVGNYPFWLRSTIDPSYGLTAANTASARYGLQIALVWFAVGITLAMAERIITDLVDVIPRAAFKL